MKKKWRSGLIALCLSFAMAVFVGCGEDDGDKDNTGGTTSVEQSIIGEETPVTYTVTYEANGGAFSNGATSITVTVEGNSKLTAPESPSRKNYSFSGWQNSNEMWDFATDTVTGNITIYATWKQQSAIILSVDGASMEEKEIFMLVDGETDSVSLADKVICSDDSTWRLYYDKLGQTEIPTKMAAGMKGYLQDGSNEFYIVVTSKDGVQVNVYELDVFRSFPVSVYYMDEEKLLDLSYANAGYEYTVDYVPQIKGYTFNYWETLDGTRYQTQKLWAGLHLYANKTPNTYTVTYDVNGGDELSATTKTLTYEDFYALAKPTRTGYTFLGWSYDGALLTDGNGESIGVWNIATDVTLTAEWEANDYMVTLNTTQGGTVTGNGEHKYDSYVTITASTNSGYAWLGWYDSEDNRVTEEQSYTFQMGFAVSYTAKWIKAPTLTSDNTSAGTVSKLNGRYNVGDKVTATAYTNSGYTFIGWYNGETLLTNELSYTFEMPTETATYTAKWCKVTLSSNNTSAGTVSTLSGKYKVGEEVTATAYTNSGYTFIGWYNGETLLTNDLSYTFKMSAENVTYTAKWCKVTLVSNNTSAGTVSTLSGQYKVGEEVTATAYTNNGYVFVGWYNGNELLTSELSYTFKMPAESVTYTANWIVVPVTLECNDANAGSVSSLNGQYKVGDETTVTAYTNIGYVFTGWYNGEELLTSEPSYTFEILATNVTYTAKWSLVDGMELFHFTSSVGYCKITSLKDETLTDIVIPDCVTSIGEGAFEDCDNLTSIEIPGSVKSIGDDAFYKCRGLADIYITDLTAWCNISFEHCDSNPLCYGENLYLKNKLVTELVIPAGVTHIKKYSFYGYGGLTSIEIPDSVKSIGAYAFYNCSELKSVLMGNGVTSIGDGAFENCDGLTSIYITDLTAWCNISFGAWVSNPLYYAGNLYLNNELVTELIIPDGITYIKKEAFEGCSGLTSIEIPDGVRSIASHAFWRCSGLTSVVIGNGVRSIGEDAFRDCDGLTSIKIPNSVTSIGEGAFDDCDNLTSIEIPDSITSIASYTFVGCNKLTSIEIPDSVTSIGDEAFRYCDGLTSVTIGNGVTSIGHRAFSYCDSLTSVAIGNGVTSIGSSAFYNCDGLTSITFNGTTAEWYAIEKGVGWNTSVPATVVVCTNGKVAI